MTDERHLTPTAAIGFLLSCVRSGERLNDEDEKLVSAALQETRHLESAVDSLQEDYDDCSQFLAETVETTNRLLRESMNGLKAEYRDLALEIKAYLVKTPDPPETETTDD